ncbi:MAG TPA: FUSC family protein [Candidatus Limnocylindrales bacterium]|nr:FUSC family protein [Candidatus Limnocylindrales bacterium]
MAAAPAESPAATRPLAGWALPGAVLGKAALVAVLALAPVVVILVLIGPPAAAGAGIGVAVGLAAATMLPVLPAAGVVLAHVLVALAGSVLALTPLGAALLVGAAGLACGPANRIGFGKAMVLLPVMAALSTAGMYDADPLRAAVGVAGGAAWAMVLVGVIGSRAGLVPRLAPVPSASAWAHAVVLALAASVATFVALTVPLPHGYWIVVTLSAVLVPVSAETVTATRDRVIGTLVGALAAVALGAVLPGVLLPVALLTALVLLVGYALVGDGARKVTMLTVLLVLVLAGATGTSTVGIALERLAWTLAAAALVAGLGYGVGRLTAGRGTAPAQGNAVTST